ncbi:RNA polymerase sigma factor [Paenibacillus hodogayensis]|uniref:RNA polymerase sigma factor n=1 Tax=Paenibacillus hodogayensis TaxID=279208 RepID=A0ABV5VWM5_9BACL
MDIEELSELIKVHGKAIYGFCGKLAGNKADTDDLYQETFLKAMEVRHKMNAAQNPKGFLISIAIRLRKNNRRKFAWRQRIAPTAELNEAVNKPCQPEGAATPEDTVLSQELSGMIQAAADRLNDKLKIPLYMHYTADMSIDEIASTLKVPPGTVKSRLYQARQAMKKTLEVESRE